jgi:hypothetical protein
MDQADKIIQKSSAFSIPKEPPPPIKVAKPKRKDNSVREQAIELLKDANLMAKSTQERHKGKIKRAITPEAAYEAFYHFEQALGGRKALIDVLQHCPENSAGFNIMQKLLNDPDFLEYAITKGNEDNVRYSLSVLCSRHRIPLSAVVTAFRDSQIAKLAAEELIKIAQNASRVVDQLIVDSTNRYDPCDVCEGTGRIWKIGDNGEWLLSKEGEHETQLCGHCRGVGKRFVRHDVQNRKEFLKMAGLIKDKEPLISQTFNQQAFMPGDGSFENILKQVDTAVLIDSRKTPKQIPNTIYDPEVIDAEIQESDPRSDPPGGSEVA